MSAKLLKAVYDSPDDDAARLVYGDWLQEKGDPRGEFITLQFRRPPTPEQEARELELVEKYGEEWQGKIGTVTNWAEFEKGFLAKCGLRNVPDWAIGRIEWATVRHVGVVDAWEGSFWKLVSHAAMKSLESVRVPDRLIAEEFEDRPTRIRILTVDGQIPLGRIERARAFEHLRELHVRDSNDRWPRLFEGDLTKRLERASFRLRRWHISLERGADGKLSAASFTPGKPRWREEADIPSLVVLLDSLSDDALTKVEITLAEKSRAGIGDLERALRRQKRLSEIPAL